MSQPQWVKRRSWHIFLSDTRMPGLARTLCNRPALSSTVRDNLPMGEKSCETCLRLFVKDEPGGG